MRDGVDTLRRAAERGHCALLDPAEVRQVLAALDAAAGPGAAPAAPAEAVAGLTAQEREVLAHVAQGMKNFEIGLALGLSHNAVKAHVSRLMAKLDCKNRTQAAILARDAGLVR